MCVCFFLLVSIFLWLLNEQKDQTIVHYWKQLECADVFSFGISEFLWRFDLFHFVLGVRIRNWCQSDARASFGCILVGCVKCVAVLHLWAHNLKLRVQCALRESYGFWSLESENVGVSTTTRQILGNYKNAILKYQLKEFSSMNRQYSMNTSRPNQPAK